MRVLVGIAARDDEEGLRLILPQIPKQIGDKSIEVLVVNDGSSDATPQVAEEIGCYVISHPDNANQGNGWARKAALRHAVENQYQLVITMDGDGQHDPRYLPQIIHALQDGYDFVRASRYHPESPIPHIPHEWLELNGQVTDAINQATGWNLTDALCGMMGFPVSIAEEILPGLKLDGYGYAVEILLRLRHRFPELRVLEIPHPAIYSGTGKLDVLYHGDLGNRKQRFAQHLREIEKIRTELGL